MSNNVYVVTDKASGQQLLVDAADDFPAVQDVLAAAAADTPTKEVQVAAIATTHQHWDHVRALSEAVDAYPAPTYAGADDVAGILEESGVQVAHPLSHGDQIQLGEVTLEAIHLRGHTPGSVAFALADSSGQHVILTGDSLFPGGIGNTWKDPQRFASLYADVTSRIFDRFPDESVILPGHGDGTTLGAERPSLPEWQERGW